MQKIILASHGNLAEGMLQAATVIGGKQDHLTAYGMDHYESPQGIYDALHHQISNQSEDEFIILCDIRGGSVHNKLVEFCVYPNVYVVTGMNLCLVLELLFAPQGKSTKENLLEAIELAKENLIYIDAESIKSNSDNSQEEEEIW